MTSGCGASAGPQILGCKLCSRKLGFALRTATRDLRLVNLDWRRNYVANSGPFPAIRTLSRPDVCDLVWANCGGADAGNFKRKASGLRPRNRPDSFRPLLYLSLAGRKGSCLGFAP